MDDDSGDVLLRKLGTTTETVARMDRKLSCTDWYVFWVAWRRQGSAMYVSMGEGAVPGDKQLIVLQDTTPPPDLGAVALTTTDAQTGTWLYSNLPSA